MTFLNLIVCALAVWEIVEIWHHSVIMAPCRDRAELWQGDFGSLLRCPFCLSPWCALLCWGVLRGQPCFSRALQVHPTDGWVTIAIAFGWIATTVGVTCIWAFAIARLANLGNDIFYSRCRTVRHNRLAVNPLDRENTQ